VAGTVAPVSKTVTYGTVFNIPGEPLKCWITSNLGADHQAYAVDDPIEASAGWYWQFNRKQGYKYDTARTPNTVWINSIIENSDWIALNDPCTLELGTGWRIPTVSEWANISVTWYDWTDPWNSGLKLHAAGFLYFNGLGVVQRGSTAWYWSSSQHDVSSGYDFIFSSGNLGWTYSPKEPGYSVRCLRN
jgi:hypothetical protein